MACAASQGDAERHLRGARCIGPAEGMGLPAAASSTCVRGMYVPSTTTASNTTIPQKLGSVDRAVNEPRGIATDDRHAFPAMLGCWRMGSSRASATPTGRVTNPNPCSHQPAAPDHEYKHGGGRALVTWRHPPDAPYTPSRVLRAL